jgi:hypothetical protein
MQKLRQIESLSAEFKPEIELLVKNFKDKIESISPETMNKVETVWFKANLQYLTSKLEA